VHSLRAHPDRSSTDRYRRNDDKERLGPKEITDASVHITKQGAPTFITKGHYILETISLKFRAQMTES
jgi:hypothetical protein